MIPNCRGFVSETTAGFLLYNEPMRKIQIILLVLIVIGLGLIFTQKFWVDRLVGFIIKQTPATNSKNDPLNNVYRIGGEEFVLVNGKAEKETVSGSASKNILRVFGEPVYGDLDQDGDYDAALLLENDPGGSGRFYYAVLVMRDGEGFWPTNTMLLGDRIAPQTIEIREGRAVFNYADRLPLDPMTTAPSIGKSVWVHYDKNRGEIGEWVKDFEGESR